MSANEMKWAVEKNGHGHYGMLEVIGPALKCVGFTIATDVDADRARKIERDAHLIAAAPMMAEALDSLIRAAARLSVAAQTTGGVAGRDEGLCAEIDRLANPLGQARSILAEAKGE